MQETEPKQSERFNSEISPEQSEEIFRSFEKDDSSWDDLKRLADL